MTPAALSHRNPELAAALYAIDRADAAVAVQGALQSANAHAHDCEICGERIAPDERVASPLSLHCVACRQGLAHAALNHRSPYCNLR